MIHSLLTRIQLAYNQSRLPEIQNGVCPSQKNNGGTKSVFSRRTEVVGDVGVERWDRSRCGSPLCEEEGGREFNALTIAPSSSGNPSTVFVFSTERDDHHTNFELSLRTEAEVVGDVGVGYWDTVRGCSPSVL
jgi:hypothetical protein